MVTNGIPALDLRCLRIACPRETGAAARIAARTGDAARAVRPGLPGPA